MPAPLFFAANDEPALDPREYRPIQYRSIAEDGPVLFKAGTVQRMKTTHYFSTCTIPILLTPLQAI